MCERGFHGAVCVVEVRGRVEVLEWEAHLGAAGRRVVGVELVDLATDLQLVERAILAQHHAPALAVSGQRLYLDAVREERAGELGEGVDVRRQLLQQLAELGACPLDDGVGVGAVPQLIVL